MANSKEIVPIITDSDTLAHTTNAQNEVENSIFTIRGVQVMLDSDLAKFFNVETKSLNQAVKRNKGRFPEDFMFQLTKEEYDSLRSQIVTLDNEERKQLEARFDMMMSFIISGLRLRTWASGCLLFRRWR